MTTPGDPAAAATVVGGGMSGVACAASLAGRGVDVALLDSGRRLAGRMASRTLRDTGTAADGRVVDIGASYFTAADPGFAAVVHALIARGVVRPWTDSFHVAGPAGIEGVRSGPVRYAAPGGLRSVVEALADGAPGLRVRQAHAVEAVRVDAGALSVDGERTDAVAICMPQPQAVRIAEDLPASPLTWEPVIAVTCVFDRRYWVELDGVFVNDDPVLTWIADDGSRRGDDAPVLVAHVNPVLAARHLEDPASVAPLAIAALQRVLAIDAYPDWVDCHRWTLAKPLSGSDEPYWLHEDVNLGLAGDAWSGGPRVEAAWLSGHRLGMALGARLVGAA
jgi:predicted NAD/FAD-dependent oxidoreductase